MKRRQLGSKQGEAAPRSPACSPCISQPSRVEGYVWVDAHFGFEGDARRFDEIQKGQCRLVEKPSQGDTATDPNEFEGPACRRISGAFIQQMGSGAHWSERRRDMRDNGQGEIMMNGIAVSICP